MITFDHAWVSRLKEENDKHGGFTEAPAVHLDNLAYVVYSSGTTGKPKGEKSHLYLIPTSDIDMMCNLVFFQYEMLLTSTILCLAISWQ